MLSYCCSCCCCCLTLGFPREHNWVLHGPENDRTLGMRNWLAYGIGRRMDRYASRTRYFELFLNTVRRTWRCSAVGLVFEGELEPVAAGDRHLHREADLFSAACCCEQDSSRMSATAACVKLPCATDHNLVACACGSTQL